jgi:hypothetical protein
VDTDAEFSVDAVDYSVNSAENSANSANLSALYRSTELLPDTEFSVSAPNTEAKVFTFDITKPKREEEGDKRGNPLYAAMDKMGAQELATVGDADLKKYITHQQKLRSQHDKSGNMARKIECNIRIEKAHDAQKIKGGRNG